MRPDFYTYLDLLAPLYLVLFYYIATLIVNKNKTNPLYKKYFLQGFWYKMLGAFGFYLVYAFYYRGGDSCTYFVNGVAFNEYMIFENFGDGLRVIFSNIWGVDDLPAWIVNKSIYYYQEGYILRNSKALLVVRVSAVVSIFSLNSYLCTCMTFGFLSYLAIFKLFVLFCELFPMLHKQFSFAFLKIPSVIFWGSAVNKDTICLAMLCVLIYTFYRQFVQLRFSLKYMLYMLLSIYLIFNIKNYILIAAIPGLFVLALVNYQNKIVGSNFRFVTTPLMILVAALSFAFLYQSIAKDFEELSTNSIEERAEGFMIDHSRIQETQGGSGYSLGEFEYTTSGILKKAPLALAVTLFGPFPWQVRNIVMLLSTLESTYFLYLFFITLVNRKGINLFFKRLTNPILLFCISFVIILGVTVGLTSFNYGALVRFKIPVLPFFAVFLALISYYPTTIKNKKALTNKY